MKKILFLISSLAFLNMCSYEVEDYVQSTSKRFFTIEAELSNIEGKSFVNINLSSEKTVSDVIFTPVEKAKVYFIDNQGIRVQLNEINYGFYKPISTFKGEIGKSYTLRIETTEGGVYESTAEKMLASPPIDSVYDVFEERTNFPVGAAGRYVYNAFLDFKDSPATDEYYQWTSTNFTQVNICKRCPQSKWNPTTQRCERQVFRTTSYIYGCSEKCFDINQNQEIILLSDKNVNGNTVKRQKLATIPFGDLTRYYLLIEQRRLTENAFAYLTALKQARGTGTFFDIPALTRFSNNIKSSKAEEKIIGVWNVFSAVQKPLIIERNKVTIKEYIPQPPFEDGIYEIPPLIFFPCEETATRTKVQPVGWK